jgi:8-amino-7-oxononanoate synthase
MPANPERALDALGRRGRLRRLEPRRGLDFTSNDYLGLAESDALRAAVSAAIARGVPVGAGGSRLLRGNHDEHEALEAEAAQFFGAETALYFGGGYQANSAVLATLPQRGDLIISDELIHASAHEGMRLSKADRVSVRHNNVEMFDAACRGFRARSGASQIWIAVESLYSMDGDRAPLTDLASIADRHDAMLLIDEAHATGVFGPQGRGLGSQLEGRPNVISLHTCGKALGCSGALVLAPKTFRDFLINRARAFIYATAPSPLMAAAVRAALEICANEPERREALHGVIARTGEILEAKTGIKPSGSQIQPVIIGADAAAVSLSEALQARGFDIRAIRPPTVPEGTARLRLTLTANDSEEVISQLIAAIAGERARLKL